MAKVPGISGDALAGPHPKTKPHKRDAFSKVKPEKMNEITPVNRKERRIKEAVLRKQKPQK